MSKMINPSISVAYDDWDELVAKARRNERSASAEVRIAIRNHLKEKQDTVSEDAPSG